MPLLARAAVIVLAIISAIACGRRAVPAADEPPTLDVTSWTTKSELFMEYPPLVTGQKTRFAVHLTRLADFKALNAGSPSIEFTPESGGAAIIVPGTAPLRPGAFRVEGAMPAAGRYRWALLVNAPDLTDRHDLGVTTIFPDDRTAIDDAGKQHAQDPAAISYLKEQQWTNPFATTMVRDAEVRNSVRVPATIATVAGGEALVSAPASGRFSAASLPAIGTLVRAGQELGRLEPRLTAGADRATLAAEVAQAQVAVDAAAAEQARADRLVSERAAPARRAEDARRAVAAAAARFQAAQAQLAQRDQALGTGGGNASGNAFLLRAPIAGRLVEVSATLGASFQEGAPLFKIVRTDRVEVRTHIPASEAALARQSAELAFEVPGLPDPIPLKPERVHDPGVIDPRTGALPLVFEIQNANGVLLIGQSGTAVLYRRDRRAMPVVPRAAVLTEGGRPYVWIQAGGEEFVRKFIEIGARDGGEIGVLAGVTAGDRVVIRGAYEVQLASAARGLAAEGHVH